MTLSSFRRLTADGNIGYGRMLITNILITGNAADLTAAVYDGQDANSGQLICTFTTRTTGTNDFPQPIPIVVANGLYVNLGTSITEVTIVFVRLSNEEYVAWQEALKMVYQ